MSEQQKPSLGMISLKWGAIIGVVLSAIAFIVFKASLNWILSTILTLGSFGAGIFMAHNEYKAKSGGVMGYGRGLGVGTLTSTFAAIIAAAVVTFVVMGMVNSAASQATAEFGNSELGQAGREAVNTAANALGAIAFFMLLISYVFWGFITSLIVSAFTQQKGA